MLLEVHSFTETGIAEISGVVSGLAEDGTDDWTDE